MNRHASRLLALCLLATPASLLARTPEEVACEEAKLGRLIHRFSTPIPGDNLFVWPTGGDTYSGLSVATPLRIAAEGLVRDELQLAFGLNLHRDADLLNPRRALLPQAVLVRRDAASNLSATAPVMSASLELAPETLDPTRPLQGLVIAGRLGASFGSASGAGRALEAENLFERCSAEAPSAFDLQVFEILSRTLRITEELLLPNPGQGLDRYKTIFFREVDPQVYRVKAFLYYTTCDPECGYSEASFQMRVRMPLDADGRLTAGGIEALPWCISGAPPPCTSLINPGTAVIVAPPLFAGHETQTEAQFRSGAFLNIRVEDDPENILTDDVPWPDLLRGTAWDRPLGMR